MRSDSPAFSFLEDMVSGGGLVKGVHSLSGHHNCSLEEHHVESLVMFRTEGGVHDDCVELVSPLLSKTTDIGVDNINIVDFEI